MIFKPVSLTPSNARVNPAIDNDFSWVQQGTPQTDYQVIIKKVSDNSTVYDSTKTTSTDSEHTVPAATLVAGTQYYWYVVVWAGVSTATSDFAWIQANSLPTVEFVDPDFSSGTPTLTTQNYTFLCSYSQAEDVPIKSYQFIFYDNAGTETLFDTGVIYGFTPQYTPTFSLVNGTYNVECKVVAQNDLTATTGQEEFIIDYTIPTSTPLIEAEADNCNGNITIRWADLKAVFGVDSGTTSYVTGKFNKGFSMDSGADVYFDQTVDADDFTLTIYARLPYDFDGDILDLDSDLIVGYDLATNTFYITKDATTVNSDFTTPYTLNALASETLNAYASDTFNDLSTDTLTDNYLFILVTKDRLYIKIDNPVSEVLVDETYTRTTSADFSVLTIYGKAIIDQLHMYNTELTNAEIIGYDIETETDWSFTTNYLAKFEDNLSAGNISVAEPITGWRIKRREEGSSLIETIEDSVAKTTLEYIDVSAANNISYEYSVFTLTASGESLGQTATATSVDFWGWILTDKEDTYKFDAELDTGTITNNFDVYDYENYTQFPATSFGKRNYKTGSISAIPMIDREILTKEEFDSLANFINNGETKILKNTFGDVYYVTTRNLRSSFISKVGTQIPQITFDWQQTEAI